MVFLVFTPLMLAQVIGADVVKLHTVLGLARLTLQIKSMGVTGSICGCHTGESSSVRLTLRASLARSGSAVPSHTPSTTPKY